MKFLGKSENFFSDIVKRLGKFIRCLEKFHKILEILRGTLGKILKKQKVNFEEIFWVKKCTKSKVVCHSPFAPIQTGLHFRDYRLRVT